MKDHAEAVKKIVGEIFKKDGRAEPIVLMFPPEGSDPGMAIMPAGELMGNKDLLARVLTVVRQKFETVVLVTESWMVKLDGKTPESQLDKMPAPSKHPDRIEAVTLIVYEGDSVKMLMAEIKRPKAPAKPFLAPWEEIGGKDGECVGGGSPSGFRRRTRHPRNARRRTTGLTLFPGLTVKQETSDGQESESGREGHEPGNPLALLPSVRRGEGVGRGERRSPQLHAAGGGMSFAVDDGCGPDLVMGRRGTPD